MIEAAHVHTHFTAWNGPQKCLITGIALQALGLLVAAMVIAGLQVSGVGVSVTFGLGFISMMLAAGLAVMQRSQRQKMEEKGKQIEFPQGLSVPDGTYFHLSKQQIHGVKLSNGEVHLSNKMKNLSRFTQGKHEMSSEDLATAAALKATLPEGRFMCFTNDEEAWYLLAQDHIAFFSSKEEAERRGEGLSLTAWKPLALSHTKKDVRSEATFYGNPEKAFRFVSVPPFYAFDFKEGEQHTRVVMTMANFKAIEIYEESLAKSAPSARPEPLNLPKILPYIIELNPMEYFILWSEKAMLAVLIAKSDQGVYQTLHYGPLKADMTYNDGLKELMRQLNQTYWPSTERYEVLSGGALVTWQDHLRFRAEIRDVWYRIEKNQYKVFPDFLLLKNGEGKVFIDITLRRLANIPKEYHEMDTETGSL